MVTDRDVTPTDEIIRNAAKLGSEFDLRGYGALHCASAMTVGANGFFGVSEARALVDAWQPLGAVTIGTNQ